MVRVEPDQTLLTMLMVNLLPEETLKELDKRFGSSFRELSQEQQLALATVAIEGKVTHTRLKSMTSTHPHDLTKELSALVKDGFFVSAGATRGTFYFFAGEESNTEIDLASQSYGLAEEISPQDSLSELRADKMSSDRLEPSCDRLESSSDHLESSSDIWESLKALAASVRNKGKVPSELMGQTICQLCQDRFLTHRQLEELLDRSATTLRVSYLSKMVKTGQLELRYPDKPTHPEQAYRTKNNLSP
ncbi:hypothetical protein [Scytonema sp. NUACC26]|uniref:hypothetical protein n=1 Tax=Scytonema sp. NUACC26 TaxID=3140176 RepID=UPI0034DC4588